jgi:hypothetical protein
MERCKNCKYWETSLLNSKGAGDCCNEKFVYTGEKKTPKDGLGYWDNEGYDAGFETGEDFGCIHWEER